MDSRELKSVLANDNTVKYQFQGIYSANNLPARLQTGQSLIFNCCNSNLPGKHWLCLYQNSKDELEMFDSFGRSPTEYGLNGKLPYSNICIYNRKQLQGRSSSVCGVYCLFYLYYKTRDFPVDKIVNSASFSNDYNQNDCKVVDYVHELYNLM